MERKTPKYEYHKIRESKAKTLTEIEQITEVQAHKNTRKLYRDIDRHGRLYQSEESKSL